MQSSNIKKANKVNNPMTEYSVVRQFQTFDTNGSQIKLETKRLKKLNEETKKWIFSLFERNMRRIYEASKEGYNEEEKRVELFDMRSYYLIATEVNGNRPIGYCHFRFDMDNDSEVIYCYELQIESDIRKAGLGQYMMRFLETLCKHLKIEKVVLTCSKLNTIGQNFFRNKMNYINDDTDPYAEDVDYQILSKTFWKDGVLKCEPTA